MPTGWVGARRGGAVLGSPIAHSLSPVLHQTAYAGLGLHDWRFTAVESGAEQLPATLRGLDAGGLAGVALTMPLKQAVLPLLARIEPLARDVGAVNTVCFGGPGGDWWGANTDVVGLVGALQAAGGRRSGESVGLILGGGATAASAVAALAQLGVREVTAAVRRPGAAERLRPVAAIFGVELAEARLEPGVLAGRSLVVSTLPPGAADPIAAGLTGRVDGLLLDVVYAGWPTALASAWAGAGGQVVGGLDLLVRQAAEQVRLMIGRDPDLAAMRAAGERALADAAAYPPGTVSFTEP